MTARTVTANNSNVELGPSERKVVLRVETQGKNRYCVSGGTAPHIVTVGDARNECDCADYKYRRHACRHIAAVEHFRNADPQAGLIDKLDDEQALAMLGPSDAATPKTQPKPAQPKDQPKPPGQPPALDPWPDRVDGGALVADVRQVFEQYLVLPDGAAQLLATFVLYSYVWDRFQTAPYIALLSPTPECGKSLCLELVDVLVAKSWLTAVPSTAVLFRKLHRVKPVLLLDEVEVIRQGGDRAQDCKALLQAGYRRGATVARCVGANFDDRDFEVFGPKLFACIGDLPTALLSRCIVVRMRRKQASEPVSRFYYPTVKALAVDVKRRCLRWSADVQDHLIYPVPDLPGQLPFLSDRQMEAWEPLFSVALACGDGPTCAAVVAAEQLAKRRPTAEDYIEMLVQDIADAFTATKADVLPTARLVEWLKKLEYRPWDDGFLFDGQFGHLTPNRLAQLLRQLEIVPTRFYDGDQKVRGYKLAQFTDAVSRYGRG